MPPFIPRKRRASTQLPDSPKPKAHKTAPTKPPQVEKSITNAKESIPVHLEDSDSDSLSVVPSDQFEDVHSPKTNPALDSEDDDEDHDDWEDAIADPNSSTIASKPDTPSPTGDLELDLDKHARLPSAVDLYSGSKGPSKIERHIRVQTHCMHVQCLLFHNVVRNAWACDKEVQRILVSQLPKGIEKEVARWKVASGLNTDDSPKTAKDSRESKGKEKASHAERISRDWGQKSERLEKGTPDLSRGEPLVALLRILTAYWKKRFVVTAPGLRKVGYKPSSVLQQDIKSFQNDEHDSEIHGERVEDIKQFRHLARQCHGSRDVGAQLFTALLRGLGIEARMVANLQPVGFGWSKGEEASVKREEEIDEISHEELGGDQPSLNAPSTEKLKGKSQKSKSTAPKSKSKLVSKNKTRGKDSTLPIELSSSDYDPTDAEADSEDDSVVMITPRSTTIHPNKKYDQDLLFPVYWTESISPISNDVIPVDALVLPSKNAIAVSQDQLTAFEPRGANAEKTKQIIAYVVAYSQDGTAKDVTTRYLKRHTWPGKTKGMRIPVEKVPVYNKRGRVKRYEDYDWFKDTLRHYTRSSTMRTAVDDLEEAKDLKPTKLEKKETTKTADTLTALKNSADFVLERFLRREEAIKPGSKHVRVFKSGKGDKEKEEKVFLRKDVERCLSAESWHKEGRKVKAGEYPLKHVPVRAVTLTRKREVEEAERETGEKLLQGLYGLDQTEWIIPPPIKNGKIPKNAYGNMDCFVPSMIPKGAVHIPYRGTVKICKRLNIDYAEAVMGFEFGHSRAVPVIAGVIVAAENEVAVMKAYEAEEEAKREKAEGKQVKLVLGTWRKFLIGLRIAERVRTEYGNQEYPAEEVNFLPAEEATNPEMEGAAGGFIPDDEFGGEGGFLVDEDDDKAMNGSGEMIVDHGKDSESDGEPSQQPSFSYKLIDRVTDAYPQTPASLSSPSKRRHITERVQDTKEKEFDGLSSVLSELSSLPPESEPEEPEVVETARKASRSAQPKRKKTKPLKEQSTPKRRLRERGAKGQAKKSPYFS
jgi:xeroderma pigmentosum group C-complementing protein